MDNATSIYRLPSLYEPFSAISHLVGALLFLILGGLLLWRGRGRSSRLIFLSLYAGSAVLVMTMSGVYHMSVGGSAARRVLLLLDHSAIFVFIAGTFTPVLGLLFHGWMRWGTLALVWTIAVAGVTLKTVFFDSVAEWFGLILYLGLGWFGAFPAALLARRYGFGFIEPLFLGGIVYSLGGLTDFLRSAVLFPGVVHAHEVFHMAVLIAALLHFQLIWQIAKTEV